MAGEIDYYEIEVQNRLTGGIKGKSNWFLGLGVLFLVLGLAAIAFPWVATLSLNMAIGLILIIIGVTQVFQAFSVPQWRGFGPSLLLASLALILGGFMIFYPPAGAVTLATLLMVYLLLTGVVKITFAWKVRPALGWGWIFTSGLLSLALGLLILFQVTVTVPWVLGLLIGIDLIFSGIWILVLVYAAKRLS
ncbi:MAG: DUF308 domain-containing protein [Oleiphilaceae bacterium]|nr:DUF308 domain-containing protein [Oleiphilaceae bacterium]